VKPQQAKMVSVVVVPECVKGKWQAVKIAVLDKSVNKRRVYNIAIGSEIKLPGSDLTLKVLNFLPHFVLEGTTLTSQSNELKNPAAHIGVSEGKREIFRGWLFRLYPTTHAFQHPQYSFALVDYIPTRGK
jgi:hypothetical protein